MSLNLQINLKPEDQVRLSDRARAAGLTFEAYVQSLIEHMASMDPRTLRTLPREERNRILGAQAAEAAALYEADLSRPISERELAAFTALDGEPVDEHTV